MENFKTIETQEELNAVIGDRVAKARASERKAVEEELGKKYADYETIKAQLTEKEDRITELGNQLEQAKTAGSTNDQAIKELQAKVHKYESDSVKTRIAQEFGLDSNLANRLTGETEEEIRQDAQTLKDIVGTRMRRVEFRSEQPGEDDTREALRKMLQTMKED